MKRCYGVLLALTVAVLTLLPSLVSACGSCDQARCKADGTPFWCVSVCDAGGCLCLMGGGDCVPGYQEFFVQPIAKGDLRAQKIYGAIAATATSQDDMLRWCAQTPSCVFNGSPMYRPSTATWGSIKTLYR